MKYNESNFTYLKVTSLSRYYTDLLKAECACEDFPRVTKIIVRKVVEAFIREIAVSYGLSKYSATGELIKSLRYNKDFNIPEEIYDYIQIIRVNGIGITLYRSRDKRIDKHPIEILELIHRVFCWYLKEKDNHNVSKVRNLSFKAPNTISFEENELKKVKRDISLKDNQINNLREKIIDLAQQSKSVGELNRIIIAIKEEKEELKKYESFLIERITSHKYEIEQVYNIYKNEIEEFDLLKDECIENHRILAKKESLLVRAEIDKQQIKSMLDELEEKDSIIEEKEQIIEIQLEAIRNSYKKSLELTNRYQDDSETIMFSYNDELKKILGTEKLEIKNQLSFEDDNIYNRITEYDKSIEDIKKKIVLFKGILDDKIKKSIKYNDFYNAFLNLNGNKLRVLYSMVSNWNKSNLSLLSKSKEWLLKKSSEQSFLDVVIKTIDEIKDISDDQIKLLLYYKLLRISQIEVKNICNRKNFIRAVDSMIQSAYVILTETKDFNYYLSKTHVIKVYYLKKVIEKLKNRYKNIKFRDELIFKIYDEIIKLSFKNEVYFAESLKIDVMNEHSLKTSIKKQPFEFLSIIIEVGEESDYRIVYGVIFQFLKDITASSHDIAREQLSLEKFLTGPFRIMLFISAGDGFNSRYLDQVIPLFVGEVLISDSLTYSTKVDFDSYNRMIDVWKNKQNFYRDKLNEKNDIEEQLNDILKEKIILESNIESLYHEQETLEQKYASYEDEFKKIIFSSEKIRMLESYEKYKEYESKKQEPDSSIKVDNESSIIEVWVEQASKKINESNIIQIQTKIIEEAKNSSFFRKEYDVFNELKNRLGEIDNNLHNNKKILEEKKKIISIMESKLEKLNIYLDSIKELYPDIE